MIIGLGIASIVLGIVGGITFGVIGSGLGCAAGIAALVLSINAKKSGNADASGNQAGFVCAIIGVVFSAIFFLGCGICGLTERGSIGTKGYTCYGCVGGNCMAERDVNNFLNDLW